MDDFRVTDVSLSKMAEVKNGHCRNWPVLKVANTQRARFSFL